VRFEHFPVVAALADEPVTTFQLFPEPRRPNYIFRSQSQPPQ
jgi:hypothetical protein